MNTQPVQQAVPMTTGANAVLDALVAHGVDVVFGYPGGAILPVYDALCDSPLRHILCRHEQGSVLAADGYARATGRVGVCIVTSGPGVTNVVTGLANALLDSVPLVVISGQVPTHALGTDAFQCVDTLGMTMPVVKHNLLVREAKDLPLVMAEALRIAESGRPGPVVVDLPKDVQLESFPLAVKTPPRRPGAILRMPVAESVRAAQELLRSAKRPVVYAGGGVGMADAVEAFRRFVDEAKIPTVTTLKGLGALPPKHPLNLGMLGMHGLEAANKAVQESDLLVVLGARFDDRVTGKIAGFAPKAKVLHCEIDPSEIGKVRRADVSLVGDLMPALAALSDGLDGPLNIAAWRLTCKTMKKEHAWDYNAPHEGVYAPRLLKALSESQGPRGIISCDVGQHQMWVAQHCGVHTPENHLSSGGLGTMGYGLPAAIGAQLGRPNDCVVNVSGDGSFMMNVQELATLKRYQLPVKILLLDNSCLGMVRQWQELFLDERYSETDLSDNPDFVKVAKAFGVQARQIVHRDEEADGLSWLLASEGPALLHVCLDRMANVWPFVPPGHDNSTMLKGEAL
jgi:acetolactate synthase-1/2/3 large subunit